MDNHGTKIALTKVAPTLESAGAAISKDTESVGNEKSASEWMRCFGGSRRLGGLRGTRIGKRDGRAWSARKDGKQATFLDRKRRLKKGRS